MRTGGISIGLLILACMARPSPAYAETWGGAGGPFVLQFSPRLEELNTHLRAVVGDAHGGMRLVGLGGLVGISPNLRVGGAGAQGGSVLKGEGRISELSIEYGGLCGEYVLSLSRIECFAGAMIGWGSLRLRISRENRDMNWDDFWDFFEEEEDASPENLSGNLSASFFCHQPYVGAQVKLNDWLYLRGNIGYFGGRIGGEDWNESGIQLRNGPSVNFSNYTAQLTLLFGSFIR